MTEGLEICTAGAANNQLGGSLFGVVKNVWFSGRKGWDFCFVSDCSDVTEGELMDFSGTVPTPVPVRGLTCGMWEFNPLFLQGATVTRYGHQKRSG